MPQKSCIVLWWEPTHCILLGMSVCIQIERGEKGSDAKLPPSPSKEYRLLVSRHKQTKPFTHTLSSTLLGLVMNRQLVGCYSGH